MIAAAMACSVEAGVIIQACEQVWPAYKGACNFFAIHVALRLGIPLSGSADNIKSQITTGSQWQPLANGVEAKNAADKGLFVLGALAGYEQVVKDSDGHVVVVVSGPLAHSAYPTAYWGSVAVGVAAKYQTVNYAWAKADRDRVHYACWRPSAT